MSDPMIREVGHMETSDGYTLSVGVDYDHIAIYVGAWCSADGVMLSSERAEEFAQLFLSAVWQAGQQKARMDEESAETGTAIPGPGPDGERAAPFPDRAAALEALARDMLGRFCQGQDGYRARAGQVQVRKWEAVLDGESGG